MLSDVDLILIEGYKDNRYPQIGVMRTENGKGFTNKTERFEALVTDDGSVTAQIPVFYPDDVEAVAAYIVDNMKNFEISL